MLESRCSEQVARAVLRLVDALEPEHIYAYGSQARGTATPESDVDLAIIVTDSDGPGYRRDQTAYGAVGGHTVPIDLLVLTTTEFEAWRRVPATLAATIAAEGREFYAASG